MSLHDAVLEIVTEMEREADDFKDQPPHGDFLHLVLRGFARQLRSAVKAAEGVTTPMGTHPAVLDSSYQHAMGVEQARAALRAERLAAERHAEDEAISQAGGVLMVELVGGPESGMLVQAEPNIRPGMMPVIGDCVYRYEGGKLVYQEEETAKFLRQRGAG